MDWWNRWESPSIINPTDLNSTTINKKNSFTKLNKLTNGTDNK
jgi:hypothetical protein